MDLDGLALVAEDVVLVTVRLVLLEEVIDRVAEAETDAWNNLGRKVSHRRSTSINNRKRYNVLRFESKFPCGMAGRADSLDRRT